LLAGGVGLAAAQTLGRWGESFGQSSPAELTYTHNAALSVTDAPNSYKDITAYNNYYEFGTDKSDPAQNSQGFRPQPWKVNVAARPRLPARTRSRTS
jgi:sulfoxide reductase catalytic subunit YedY